MKWIAIIVVGLALVIGLGVLAANRFAGPRDLAAPPAQIENGAAVYFAEAFFAAGVEPSHAVSREASDALGPVAVIAAQGAPGAPSPADRGVYFLLGADVAALVGEADAEVAVTVRRATPGAGLAVSLQGAGGVEWAQGQVPEGGGEVTIRAPAVFLGAPDALGLWVVPPDGESNAEVAISRLSLRPAPPLPEAAPEPSFSTVAQADPAAPEEDAAAPPSPPAEPEALFESGVPELEDL